ncbi:MAG: hypothetical protein MI919_11300, partial [Holophagales bacterium]|nr:hypothetical protein [Holophagales bacterium]
MRRRRPAPLAAGLALGLAASGLAGVVSSDRALAQPRESRPGWESEPAGGGEAESHAADLLLTPGRLFEGREEVDALVIDPEVRELVFLLDGEEVARRGKPPWRARLPFADPARPQTVTLRALGPRDRPLSEVSREVNRFRRRFRARLSRVEAVPGGVRAAGEVTVPEGTPLERLELILDGDEPVALELPGETSGGRIPFDRVLPVEASDTGGDPVDGSTFVTVRAVARGGVQVEDVAFLGHDVAAVDVRLVELQVLVNRKGGPPVRDGLEPADFHIREGGRARPVERLVRAADAPLRLGLVIDASGSMEPIWQGVRAAVRAFLDHAVGPDDRVFLVSFDS